MEKIFVFLALALSLPTIAGEYLVIVPHPAIPTNASPALRATVPTYYGSSGEIPATPREQNPYYQTIDNMPDPYEVIREPTRVCTTSLGSKIGETVEHCY